MSIAMPALEVWLYVSCYGWMNVADRLRNATMRHGRTDELDGMQAGIANLTLDNRDRLFDPSNASSVFYSSMNNGSEFSAYCEVYASYGGESYALFYGHVTGWSYEPDVSGDSTVTLEVFDEMGSWARTSAEVDAYTTQWKVLSGYNQAMPTSNSYTAWWLPMGSTMRTIADAKSNYVDPTYPTPTLPDYSFTFTTTTPLTDSAPSTYMSGASTQFDGTYGAIGPVVTMENTTGSPIAYDQTLLGFWIKTETAGPAGYLNPILSSASSATVRIGVDDGGRLAVVDAGGTVVTLFPINDGNWHNVWIKRTALTSVDAVTTKALAAKYNWKIYVDGILLGENIYTTWTTPNFNLLAYGSPATSDSQYFTGSLAHLQLLRTIFNQDGIPKTMHLAGRYGRIVQNDGAYDTAKTRETALHLGISASEHDSDGSVDVNALKYGGTLIDLAQQIEVAEQGRIFINHVGYTTSGSWVVYQGGEFQSRSYSFTSARATTAQYTFGDADVASNIPVAAIGKIYNDIRLYRQAVNLNLPDGTSVRRDNPNVVATTQVEVPSYDVPIFQADANSWADAYLTKYSAPQIRIENWTVRPQTKPSTAFRACLTTKIGDRVTLDFAFRGQGSQLTRDVFVESIAHNITPELWETTFSGSPAMNAWVLEDATYGLLEQTTILA
jgi:hypothetical protein